MRILKTISATFQNGKFVPGRKVNVEICEIGENLRIRVGKEGEMAIEVGSYSGLEFERKKYLLGEEIRTFH